MNLGFVTPLIAAAVFAGIGGAAQAAPNTAFVLAETQTRILTLPQAAAAEKSGTPGTVSAKNTLTFHQKTVRLVVHSGPASDMLSYRVDGLRNPTLVVPAGAALQTLFINTDDDMTHNLRFGVQHSSASPSVGTPDLPHKTETAFHAADVRLRLPSRPGTYYYYCTIRGHAPGGMWGTLIVR